MKVAKFLAMNTYFEFHGKSHAILIVPWISSIIVWIVFGIQKSVGRKIESLLVYMESKKEMTTPPCAQAGP